jgi:type I restriction enzyme S subunit
MSDALLGELFGSRGITYGVVKPGDNTPGGVPLLKAADVGPGRVNINPSFRISHEKNQEHCRTELAGGELLITLVGSPGQCAIAPKEVEGFNVVRAVGVFTVKEGVSPRYVMYAVQSPPAQRHIMSVCNTTVQTTLNLGDLKVLPLRVPPLPEQKAIAHILGTLDDKIELNRKTNETLEAMAKALFKSWFVDFDPVRAKAEGRPTGLPAEISGLFPDSFEDSELGEIPSGWKVAPVGDVVECVGGSTPSTNEPEYWDGGEYFWATPKDLSSLSEPFLLDTAKKITINGVQRISSGILPVGTILLSSRAPVGYVAAACIPVSINQGFIALKSNGLMSSAYLLNWCLSNVRQFKDRASGTTFAEISKAAFRPIPILVPSEQAARSFADKAQMLYERVVSNMRQSTLLAVTRDALLPKLISGEIRIPDAEKMLEEVGV